MKSVLTFAGLAFASFAAAGPCRPRTTTTAAAVSSSTEIASSTATETAAVSTSTDYSVPVGETTRIGIPPGTASDTSFAIYDGSPSQLWQYKAVNHRAFLYAPETGDYTVTIPNSDEITLIWFGEKAIEGWTRANADLEQDYPGGTSKTFTIHLTAGTYTPFRLLWANAQGDLNFIAEVQAPDGKVIVNGDGSDNKYFVRFACDESTPSFPDFGYGG
ncbi:hypothetical protein FPRO05_13138 [Fusarium proliferatum]|uniref:PA14 domain-containing protein n=1 Tax=Gibberella intermedia TaxID=948311 RepID=A0A365N2J9_GIBIN|nr:hypothetical protein FPRO05_13138 [Fusarium proliferatum]